MNKKISILLIMFWLLTGVPISIADQQEPLLEPLQISGPPNAAQVTHQTMEDGKLLVSVTDAEEAPILGLTVEQFSIRQGLKAAKILSVAPLATSKEVGLNLVMVVDNSKSMKFRDAITPILAAMETFYSTLRPIDQVALVVFDEQQTVTVQGRAMHAKVLQTNAVDQMREFVKQHMRSGLTEGTYLFDAMLVGLDVARRMPAKSNKFLVVFSDGEDINSSADIKDVEQAAGALTNFSAYSVDYMPSTEIDPFLKSFAANHNGRVWKASSAAELMPVFEAFSTTLLHRYVVAYRFLEAPKGTLAFAAPQLTIEEVTTIDSAPLLNYIYFETGQSDLSNRYLLFEDREKTTGFDEKNLKDAMEKYRHALNIIGLRLQKDNDNGLRIVGCNSNTGKEKGRMDLSRSRAEAVRSYLRYVWGIAPERMVIEERNLPKTPSTSRLAEGQAENQRVEIYADNPTILDTVDSAYVQKVSDLSNLRILPKIEAEAGISDWQLRLFCGQKEIKTLKGQGDLPSEWSVPLEAALLEQIATCPSVETQVQATDKEANVLNPQEPISLPIHFVQRTQQTTQVQGYKVKEQYALILFDYDSAAIKDRNQAIVDRIIARIHQVPDASVSITGHTDNIGGEAYNLALSDRRAQAVKQSIVAAANSIADRLNVAGVGPNEPMYDNTLPEGRALNRTVTITLEYMQK